MDALGTEQRRTAVDAIVAAIREKYVFPDRVPTIEARLRGSLAAGRYDVASPGAFAERVTDDLKESSRDRHMYLNVDPAQYALARTAKGDLEVDPALASYWRRLADRSNHGLEAMRILPGNVRYLKVADFRWVNDASGGAYDAAARFLRDGDAIVIDLRSNGGGSHGAVRYLISYFLAPEASSPSAMVTGSWILPMPRHPSPPTMRASGHVRERAPGRIPDVARMRSCAAEAIGDANESRS